MMQLSRSCVMISAQTQFYQGGPSKVGSECSCVHAYDKYSRSPLEEKKLSYEWVNMSKLLTGTVKRNEVLQ